MLSPAGVAGESELIELEDDSTKLSPFPLVQCRNIFVLPGVPTLLQTKWRTLRVGPSFRPWRPTLLTKHIHTPAATWEHLDLREGCLQFRALVPALGPSRHGDS